MDHKIDIEAAIKFQHTRRARRKEQNKARWQKANEDFNAICNMIISKYNPEIIIQWGSLLNADKFSEISDIDIAIGGLKNAEAYFNLLADAGNLSDMPLDIVLLKDLHPLHRQSIEQNGKVIYKRNES